MQRPAAQKPAAARKQKNSQQCGILSILLILFGIIGIVVCIFIYLSRQVVYKTAQNEYANLQSMYLSEDMEGLSAPDFSEENPGLIPPQLDLSALQDLNADCTGWIEISGTNISYPVVQSLDNEYYLTHTFNRLQNKAGSIFMDFRCAADFSDTHTILFGHNMQDGSMLSGLGQYRNRAFLETNSDIYIHLQDKILVYRILLTKQIPHDDMIFSMLSSVNSEEAIRKFFTEQLEQVVDYDENAKYLTLSTCTDNGDNNVRDIVIAVR